MKIAWFNISLQIFLVVYKRRGCFATINPAKWLRKLRILRGSWKPCTAYLSYIYLWLMI